MTHQAPGSGIKALAKKIALGKATKLSRPQAYQIWRALQLLVSNASLEGQPAAVVQLAMDFDRFPVTWKVIANKAFEHEHLDSKQKP